MLISSFVASVVQNALAVFEPELDKPFNSWSKQSYAQGFSWRPQSVSFLLIEDGDTNVEVYLEQKVTIRSTAVRAILVPFQVSDRNQVEISGIYEKCNRVVAIPSRMYALVFQIVPTPAQTGNSMDQNSPMSCVLTFVPNDSPKPAILKKDEDLSPPTDLVLDGKPA